MLVLLASPTVPCEAASEQVYNRGRNNSGVPLRGPLKESTGIHNGVLY